MIQIVRRYTELQRLSSFEERYSYLKLSGSVGKETFGFDRILNQVFYGSCEWKRVRDLVILRDNGCDLGMYGNEIIGRIIIHHMNPVSVEDIEKNRTAILDPEFLICTSMDTHNAIHYGKEIPVLETPIIRSKYDTCPWKNKHMKERLHGKYLDVY